MTVSINKAAILEKPFNHPSIKYITWKASSLTSLQNHRWAIYDKVSLNILNVKHGHGISKYPLMKLTVAKTLICEQP